MQLLHLYCYTLAGTTCAVLGYRIVDSLYDSYHTKKKEMKELEYKHIIELSKLELDNLNKIELAKLELPSK